MVDYSSSNLYFLNEPENQDIKKILEKEILRKVDDVAVKDFQGDVSINDSVSSIIRDIENNNFIKKYKFDLDINKDEEKEKE